MLIEMKVDSLAMDPLTNVPILILKNTVENRTLPIWIGVLEASAIATELEHISFSRPITHDLLYSIMTSTNVAVLKVTVTDIKDNVYYAQIHLNSNGEQITVDSRPSDAIAIALRAEAPILVDSSVLDNSMELHSSNNASAKDISKEDLMDLFEDFSPEDFGKYKM